MCVKTKYYTNVYVCYVCVWHHLMSNAQVPSNRLHLWANKLGRIKTTYVLAKPFLPYGFATEHVHGRATFITFMCSASILSTDATLPFECFWRRCYDVGYVLTWSNLTRADKIWWYTTLASKRNSEPVQSLSLPLCSLTTGVPHIKDGASTTSASSIGLSEVKGP